MLKLFLQPYPSLDTAAHRRRVAFGMGTFVFLFLYIFKPFGLHLLPSDSATIKLAGYGAVCSLILLFDLFVIPAVLPGLFEEDNWKVWKEIVYILFNITIVAFGNMVYTNVVIRGTPLFEGFFVFELFTLFVSFLPVVALVLLKQIRLLRRTLKEAHELSSHMNQKRRLNIHEEVMVTLHAENAKDNFALPAIELLYIQAADNYIDIHYQHEGKEQQKVLRASLKSAREDLRHHTAFYRCHRTWIVNLDRVRAVSGNSQGYKLILEGTETLVPVSRNLNRELTQRIAK